MAFMFENLEVYQKALNLAEGVANLTDSFPPRTFSLRDQLTRAAFSISANIAEGCGRYHKNDKKQFFYISRGSAHECIPFLRISFRRGYIDKSKLDSCLNEIEVIVKMLSGLINGMDKRKE